MDKFANLEAYVAVVEAGSFSRAAERLNVAKSMVSRRVSRLEGSLRVQLLQRTTRRLSVTTSGREFYEHAVRILAQLDEAEQAVGDDDAELRGLMRIAAPLSFGLHHLTGVIADFMSEHPGIEIDLDLNDREVDLVAEGLDMTVRIGSLDDSSLIARRLGTARFITCASPDYLAEHGTPEHPRDLQHHTALHYSNVPVAQAWQLSGDAASSRTALPRIRARANNGDALVAMATAGLGIINSPSFLVSRQISSGELVAILETFQRPASGIYAVYPPGRLLPRRLRLFTDTLAGRFGGLPDWDRAIGIED